MRRIAGAALATLGLIAALVGAGFMTIWAPESVVSASVSAPDAAYIQTEPGVIDLVGSDVTVTVTGDKDADVMLAFGLADDVEDWTEGLPVATVTGLKDWKTLDIAEDGADPEEGEKEGGEATATASSSASASASATASASASATKSASASPSASATTSASASPSASASASATTSASASPSASASASATKSASASPSASASATATTSASASASASAKPEETTEIDPNIGKLVDSDMWIQTEQEKGKISVTYRVADKGAISLIAASSSGKAPELTLEWDRPVKNTYAMPLMVIGLFALVSGALVAIFDLQKRRRESQRKDAQDRRIDRRATRAAADTTVLAKVEVPESDQQSGIAETDGKTDTVAGAVVDVTSNETDTSTSAEEKSSGDKTEGNDNDEENTHA